jgi:hypothetical protein
MPEPPLSLGAPGDLALYLNLSLATNDILLANSTAYKAAMRLRTVPPEIAGVSSVSAEATDSARNHGCGYAPKNRRLAGETWSGAQLPERAASDHNPRVAGSSPASGIPRKPCKSARTVCLPVRATDGAAAQRRPRTRSPQRFAVDPAAAYP